MLIKGQIAIKFDYKEFTIHPNKGMGQMSISISITLHKVIVMIIVSSKPYTIETLIALK